MDIFLAYLTNSECPFEQLLLYSFYKIQQSLCFLISKYPFFHSQIQSYADCIPDVIDAPVSIKTNVEHPHYV